MNPAYAAIQLPAPDWVRQPKVPGEITDRVSIHKTGPGSEARELRVEGRDNGRTGYWTKQLTAEQWFFVPTDQSLAGRLLDNTAADHTLETLAAPSPHTYTERSDRGWMATIDAFDIAVTPTLLRLDFGGDLRLDLILHTVDGLRQMPQQRGISDQPRHLDGTIEVPAAIANSLVDQPEPIRHFITDHLNGRRFADTDVTVTAQSFSVAGLGLVLPRVR
ncbi:hypothetical protein [Nocardia sp. NPDC050412]|uniref:hypothetical protein n=1 Tax=Nocardia sp. NPDC050412 TaxID=3364320 RepID=UPI003797B6DA